MTYRHRKTRLMITATHTSRCARRHSAASSLSTFSEILRNVRFTPKSGHYRSANECPLCAKSRLMHRSKISLFDHLVGVGKQHRRHGEAKHSGSLGVDDQIELAGLHHGQVRGLGALEDAAGIDTKLAKRIHDVGSITHQPANLDKVGRRIDRREFGGTPPAGPLGYAGH